MGVSSTRVGDHRGSARTVQHQQQQHFNAGDFTEAGPNSGATCLARHTRAFRFRRGKRRDGAPFDSASLSTPVRPSLLRENRPSPFSPSKATGRLSTPLPFRAIDWLSFSCGGFRLFRFSPSLSLPTSSFSYSLSPSFFALLKRACPLLFCFQHCKKQSRHAPTERNSWPPRTIDAPPPHALSRTPPSLPSLCSLSLSLSSLFLCLSLSLLLACCLSLSLSLSPCLLAFLFYCCSSPSLFSFRPLFFLESWCRSLIDRFSLSPPETPLLPSCSSAPPPPHALSRTPSSLPHSPLSLSLSLASLSLSSVSLSSLTLSSLFLSSLSLTFPADFLFASVLSLSSLFLSLSLALPAFLPFSSTAVLLPPSLFALSFSLKAGALHQSIQSILIECQVLFPPSKASRQPLNLASLSLSGHVHSSL